MTPFNGSPDQTCGGCVFYLKFGAPHIATGYCKRYPPTVIDGGQALPELLPADFCGEWKPREVGQ